MYENVLIWKKMSFFFFKLPTLNISFFEYEIIQFLNVKPLIFLCKNIQFFKSTTIKPSWGHMNF